MKTYLFTFLLSISLNLFASDFKAVAYMPSYRMANLDDLNYDMITHVMAAFANPDELGNMSYSGYSMTTFVDKVHTNGAKAIISIGGGGDYSWGAKVSIYETLFESPSSRTAFIHKIMNYVRDYGFDGLDNDIEGNALALSNFNIFTIELGDSLHAAGLEYSAAIGVGGSWGANLWSDESLSKLDFMMTMSYGGVGSWNYMLKNDEHTFAKMKSDMEHFTITKGISARKVIGGIPFYSVEFPAEAKENYNDYHQTICSVYSDSFYDDQDPFHSDTLTSPEGNPVYINSIETIERKISYCDEFGGGIMIWETGQDCYDGSISLQDSMYAFIKANKVSVNDIENIELKVFPNPVSDFVNIQTPTPFNGNYTLFDKAGRIVLEGTLKEILKIDLSSVSAGVYSLELNDGIHQFKKIELVKK